MGDGQGRWSMTGNTRAGWRIVCVCVRWEVSLISVAGQPTGVGLRDFEENVCVSLLCHCALEVPLKQARGGGGRTCLFRGAAVEKGGTDCVSWP